MSVWDVCVCVWVVCVYECVGCVCVCVCVYVCVCVCVCGHLQAGMDLCDPTLSGLVCLVIQCSVLMVSEY